MNLHRFTTMISPGQYRTAVVYRQKILKCQSLGRFGHELEEKTKKHLGKYTMVFSLFASRDYN